MTVVIAPFMYAPAVGGVFDFQQHLREVLANSWNGDWPEILNMLHRLKALKGRGLDAAYQDVKRQTAMSVQKFPWGAHWLHMHSRDVEIDDVPLAALMFAPSMLTHSEAYGPTMNNWLDSIRPTCERAIRCNQVIQDVTQEINQKRVRFIDARTVLAVVDPIWAEFAHEEQPGIVVSKQVRAKISTLDIYEVRACVNQISAAIAACKKRGITPWTLY